MVRDEKTKESFSSMDAGFVVIEATGDLLDSRVKCNTV